MVLSIQKVLVLMNTQIKYLQTVVAQDHLVLCEFKLKHQILVRTAI